VKPLAAFGFLLLMAGGLWTNARAGQERPREQKVQAEGTLRGQGVEVARLEVKVGTLRIFSDSAEGIRYRVVRHVEGGSAEERHRLLTDTSVSAERQGSAFVLKDNMPQERASRQGERPSCHLEVELHLPSRVSLDVANGVGNIEATGDFGSVVVHNGVGNVSLKRVNLSGGSVDVHTGTGNIEVAVRSLPTQKFRVNTGVGSVKVSLPAQAKASVTMQTGVGGLKSDYSLISPRRGLVQIGGEMHGDVNGGGIPIEVKVGTGDARLLKE
jgi:hypothetical protein